MTTQDKIIEAATNCFFQHGFDATTISMISRYVRVSRVTIHKYFESKEALFRCVVKHYFDIRQKNINHYIETDGDFWQLTNQLIKDRCRSIFEHISSAMIRSDLVHAGNAYCRDLILEQKQLVCQVIEKKLIKAVNNGELTLERIDITLTEFAASIESISDGPIVSPLDDDSMQQIEYTLKVYRAASIT